MAGRAVHSAVSSLAAPGRELEQAGDGLTRGPAGAADRADDVPLDGDELGGPLDLAAGAGGVEASRARRRPSPGWSSARSGCTLRDRARRDRALRDRARRDRALRDRVRQDRCEPLSQPSAGLVGRR